MANKKTYEPKEYVWELEVDGEDKIFKCLVTDTECITYEGDKEKKHLKVMNPVRKNKVLQIDTVTSIYGRQIPFQLENGVPYIKWDGGWKMSETNRQERIRQGIRVNKLSSGIEIGAGLALVAAMCVYRLITGTFGTMWILTVIGAMLIVGGLGNLSRLKAEVDAIREADAMAAEEKAARKADMERAE